MKRFLDTLAAWEGAVRGDAVHKRIVDAYNSYLPHPRGYRLTYSDDYCAAMVSAAAILCGLTDVLPIECSCGEQMPLVSSARPMDRGRRARPHGRRTGFLLLERPQGLRPHGLHRRAQPHGHCDRLRRAENHGVRGEQGQNPRVRLSRHSRQRALYPGLRRACISCGKAHVGCAATRARRSASCKSFSTPAAMSWMWITRSAPRRRRRGANTSPRTSSRP